MDNRKCFAGMQNLFEMHKKSNFIEDRMHSDVLQVFYICFLYGVHKKFFAYNPVPFLQNVKYIKFANVLHNNYFFHIVKLIFK